MSQTQPNPELPPFEELKAALGALFEKSLEEVTKELRDIVVKARGEGVRLPGDVFDEDATDLAAPTANLLQALSLLPKDGDLDKMEGPGNVFRGTPSSVWIIEAGATRATKVVAGGLGAALAAALTWLGPWWNSGSDIVRAAALIGGSVAVAVVAFSLAFIVASDVRGRAAAQVAIVQARSALAQRVVEESAQRHRATNLI